MTSIIVHLLCISLLFMFRAQSFIRKTAYRARSFGFSKNSIQANRERFQLKLDDSEHFYITTPIYYVNGLPHLGHAYTSVLSDVIARYARKDGKEVFFLTGTDEHGQKVEQSAVLKEKTSLEFCDEVSMLFRELTVLLGCSNNDFIRTTEDRHKRAAKKLWNTLLEKGQIYLGAYEGWYSIRDEAFVAEDELVDGKAPTGAEVEWVKEESYFFRLSDYTDKLLDYYEKNPDFIGPKGRRNEVISFVGQEGGLKDLSISRTTFSWGIPVPNDEKHVMYVWLDALTNYLTAVGYATEGKDFEKFWPAGLHVVGKDILRFHAIFWPAFLMAADLPLPKRVFAHGWWTKDGEKMSKSLGNVLDPLELVERYGREYVRYFLVSEIHFGNDGDFSHAAFASRINADLANDIGNLAQRCLTMINKQCGATIPIPLFPAGSNASPFTEEDIQLLQAASDCMHTVRKHLSRQNMKLVCEAVVNLAKLGNRYINSEAPWHLLKTDKERMNTVLFVLAELMRVIAVLLEPVIPESSNHMLEQIGVPDQLRTFDSVTAASPLVASVSEPGSTIAGLAIGAVAPVFPRIELEEEAEARAVEVKQKGNKNTKEALVVTFDGYDELSLQAVADKVAEIGGQIRAMKAAKAEKDALKPLIAELQYAKMKYTVLNGGEPYQPPTPTTAK